MDSRTLNQLDAWRRKRTDSNTRGISTIRRVETKWIQIQHRTFSKWVSQHTGTDIENFKVDFIDGVVFLNLMEVLSGKTVKRFHRFPQSITQRCDNVQLALDICASEDVRLTNIGAQDIANGSLKLILGLVWCLIQRYHLTTIYERRTSSLGAKDPTKDNSHKTQLLRGLNKTLDKVKLRVNNIKDDWGDGMALTALVTYLAPAFNKDFMSIERSEYISATDSAMTAAEKYLYIPRLLSAEDFTSDDVDELSMITYLSYFMDPAHKKVRETYMKEHPEYIPLYKPYIEPTEQKHSQTLNDSNNSSVFNSPDSNNSSLINSPDSKNISLINSPDSKNSSLIDSSNSKNTSYSKRSPTSNNSNSKSSSDSKKSPIKKLLSTYKDKLRRVRISENKYKEPYQIIEVDRELEREAECDGAASPDSLEDDERPVRSMSEGEPYRTYVPDGSAPVVSQAETSASSATASEVTIRHHKAIRRSARSPSDSTCDNCKCGKACECTTRRKSMPTGPIKRESGTTPQGLTRDNTSRDSFRSTHDSFRSTRDSFRSERIGVPIKPPKPDGLTRSASFTRESVINNAPITRESVISNAPTTRERLPSPEYMNIPHVEPSKEPDNEEEEEVSDSERDEILEQIFNAASVEDLTKPEDDENMPPLQRFKRSNTTVVRNKPNKPDTPSSESLTSSVSELRPFFRDHEVLAEYKLLCNNVSSGVYVIPSLQSLQVWNGVIFIKIGMFADGCFKFDLHIPDDFPYSRPSLRFITPVFHPQINGKGELNLSKAFPTWTPKRDRVWHLLRYTKRCFFSVNTFDATNPAAAAAVQDSIETFRQQARLCVDASISLNYNEDSRTNDEDNIFGGKLLNDTQLQIVRDKIYKGNLDYSLIFQ